MFYNNGIIDARNDSIYHQRCEDIQEQLKKYDVKAEVSRHTFQDKKYYSLEVDLNHNNSNYTVSKVLNIKQDDVHFIHINLKESYKIFWISEDLLHARYLDGDGRLVFETIEDEAIKLINEEDTVVTSIIENCGDITIRLKRTWKKKGEVLYED